MFFKGLMNACILNITSIKNFIQWEQSIIIVFVIYWSILRSTGCYKNGVVFLKEKGTIQWPALLITLWTMHRITSCQVTNRALCSKNQYCIKQRITNGNLHVSVDQVQLSCGLKMPITEVKHLKLTSLSYI